MDLRAGSRIGSCLQFAAQNSEFIHDPIEGERMPNKTVLATLVVASALLCSAPIFGQAAQSSSGGQSDTAKAAADLNIQAVREDIRAHRKQVLAENLTLTPDEATRFWPIYDQYIQETIKINDARWKLMEDYATNYDKMSDQLADSYMKTSATVDQQLVALREKYVPIFEKVVPPKKTALWYQIDRRLDLVINLQLAGMIPVVDASK
jgi:Spy/CpxP family protein refolding chaperone